MNDLYEVTEEGAGKIFGEGDQRLPQGAELRLPDDIAKLYNRRGWIMRVKEAPAPKGKGKPSEAGDA